MVNVCPLTCFIPSPQVSPHPSHRCVRLSLLHPVDIHLTQIFDVAFAVVSLPPAPSNSRNGRTATPFNAKYNGLVYLALVSPLGDSLPRRGGGRGFIPPNPLSDQAPWEYWIPVRGAGFRYAMPCERFQFPCHCPEQIKGSCLR